MAVFEIKGPDGSVHEIDGPNDATPDQVVAAAAAHFGTAQPSAPGSAATGDDGNKPGFMTNLMAGIGKGMTDLGLGIKQRVANAAAALRIPYAEGIAKDTQAAVDEKRRIDAALMNTAGGKIGDFVAHALPAAAAGMVPGGQGLAGTMLTGAALGAVEPTTENESALKNAAMGAAAGGAGYGLAKGAARVISPNASTNPELQLLKDEGVSPTVGQTLGGIANAVEQKLQSIPITGDAITAARNRTLAQFNNAAINRATAPIGVEIKGAGQDAIREAGDALSNAYDNALSQVPHVTLDNQFAQDVGQLTNMAQNLVPAMRDKFNSTLKNVVLSRVSPQGSMLGDTYKTIDSDLGALASKYSGSSTASESELGDAITQLQSLLNQQMRRSNPQIADRLDAIDEGWANLVRVEGAAKAAKNNSGIFTPAQLNAAVQIADDSVRGRAVARGTALMQDLSNAGQDVLGSRIPDSGTAGRLALGGGALASGFLHPGIPLSLAGGAAAYTEPMQRIISAVVSSRPAAAEPIAKAISNFASRFGNMGSAAAMTKADSAPPLALARSDAGNLVVTGNADDVRAAVPVVRHLLPATSMLPRTHADGGFSLIFPRSANEQHVQDAIGALNDVAASVPRPQRTPSAQDVMDAPDVDSAIQAAYSAAQSPSRTPVSLETNSYGNPVITGDAAAMSDLLQTVRQQSGMSVLPRKRPDGQMSLVVARSADPEVVRNLVDAFNARTNGR